MTTELKDAIRDHYAAAATAVTKKSKSSCCSGNSCDPISADLYDSAEVEGLPLETLEASLGCGNPTLLAQLNPGEVVLDLGSGGGIDVLLSARRVGPAGKAIGLDMTDEMLALARENQRKSGLQNVEFLRGDIENIPLPDNSVDVIISNCVINLSTDKKRVISEAFRVLKPGGRFAVSDVVRTKDIPEAIRRDVELWAGCIAGALHQKEYTELLIGAGFEEVGIEPTRVYTADDARSFMEDAGRPTEDIEQVDGAFISAFVRARKVAH